MRGRKKREDIPTESGGTHKAPVDTKTMFGRWRSKGNRDGRGRFLDTDASVGGEYHKGTSDNPVGSDPRRESFKGVDDFESPNLNPEEALIAKQEGTLVVDPDEGLSPQEIKMRDEKEDKEVDELEKAVKSGYYDEKPDGGEEIARKDKAA